MIILTRRSDYIAQGCLVVHSLDDGIHIAKQAGETELFIIGGGEVFSQSIDKVDKIYLTQVHTDAKADVKFPKYNLEDWKIIEKVININGQNDDFPSDFIVYQRKNEPAS